MNEHTRLYIAVCIDVHVIPSSGNTASDKLTVILKIHCKDLFAALFSTDLADSVIHVLSLLLRRKQFRRRLISNRHIVEVPGITAPLLDDHIEERITCDGLNILARVADRCAENQTVLLHQIHGMHDLFKASGATAGIIDFLISLQTDRYREIADPHHLFTKCFIDQRTVCKCMECAVIMLLAQTDQICLAHKRLASGIHIEVNAKLLALCNNGIQIFKGKIQLMPVLGSPTAGTVHVTGTGRIHQNQPRHLALQLFPFLTDRLCPKISGFKAKI